MKNSEGMYLPEMEHDSCGIGFVANMHGHKSHQIITDALHMLMNMEHRGGRGAEPETGDGAGVLIQIPHRFFQKYATESGFQLPNAGEYGVGMVFFPTNEGQIIACKNIIKETAAQLSLEVLHYRRVPTNNFLIGTTARKHEPEIEQVFFMPQKKISTDELRRKLFILRKAIDHKAAQEVPEVKNVFYFSSLSVDTIVYKGQLRTDQLPNYFTDLADDAMESAIAVIHSRFSTNTFPRWKLAQPFKYIAHNGEINTIRGNLNKMKSKEAQLFSNLFSRDEFAMIKPILSQEASDSANLDRMIELLVMAGRSLPHVMMMLIPEAWQDNKNMEKARKDFYKYHACLMEPWDGPASISFTDGTIVGATLDRNGLRPSRYCVLDNGNVIMSSEAGSLPVAQHHIVEKGRLQPGRMFVVDTSQGRIISDEEVKNEIINKAPYSEWIKKNRLKLREQAEAKYETQHMSGAELKQQEIAFGVTSEDIKTILGQMVATRSEPVGSMGSDVPLAVLSDHSQHISHYFKQLFAQVSNPPIDPIRERQVMSLFTHLGKSMNVLDETAEHCRQVNLNQPVLTEKELAKIKGLKSQGFDHKIISVLFDPGKDGSLQQNLNRICTEAEKAVMSGCSILILSDRGVSKEKMAIPALMATGAVHHHLISKKLRGDCSLVVETGDTRETHHYATIIGYGASAICPYLTLDILRQLTVRKYFKKEELNNPDTAIENYVQAINYGLLKILSKMGISTLQSYQGAQIFEIIGLNHEVVNTCFAGTVSRIGGLGFPELEKDIVRRHQVAFEYEDTEMEEGGIYQWKQRGEYHLFNPTTIHLLQQSARKNSYELYKKYAEAVNNQQQKAVTLRGLLDFDSEKAAAIPLDQVEPAASILKRFATGAMSFGSISHEAHSTLAIAMNRIGGKSNSGEGGEDEIRFKVKENGDWERSAIKQVASGRFGVTSNYLTNAAELQIKMAQGAKPGEGGQLPGHKVDDWIGRVRYSTPGVGLISPPPHHDIYSIEDLAQLIFDLKNANRNARINVKLVSEAGVGTVAAGVAKAMADVIMISGSDGGTGASPLSSIRHAGLPWELGVAEAHQTLLKNKLRSRVVLQTDGQIKTGRDIAIATLLGAEEWGVATAALVVEGCIMMRKCHMNTCPVGVATQDPDLRKLFTGKPDEVVNFFHFLVNDLREIMASLGFRTIDEMVGKASYLKVRDDISHWKHKTIDFSKVLFEEPAPYNETRYHSRNQDHAIYGILDRKLIEVAEPALENVEPVKASFPIFNTNRAVGAMLSNTISKKFGSPGLPDGTLDFHFRGSAGQSFGAFSTKGITFRLEGEANDYFGKGLSGAELVVYPDRDATFKAETSIIIGNVAFYGATSGYAFIRGMAGERFAVRNSGVVAVVEGVGDHGCEYMTGGRIVVLGSIGSNFAAGMSGGIAYILDADKTIHNNVNPGMVDLETLDDEDGRFLYEMVSRHERETKSYIATTILADWQKYLSLFTKVMPREYRAVLNKINNKELV